MRKRTTGLGFLLALAMGEVYLQTVDPYHYGEKEDWSQDGGRIMDPATGRLRPGAVATYLGRPTRISAQGWRSPEFAKAKPDGVFRILLLGGSVPFGWGVADGEEFPRVLERELNARRFRGDQQIEVINTGVPGWKLPEEGRLLIDEGFGWEPDMVMLLLVSTDVPREQKSAERGFFLTDAWRRCRLLRAIENRYVFDTPGTGGRPYDSYENLPAAGLERVAHSLSLFHAACRAESAELVVVDTLNAERLRKTCRELGVQRIEAYTTWAQRRSWEVAATDAHPDAVGHRFYGELIARELR